MKTFLCFCLASLAIACGSSDSEPTKKTNPDSGAGGGGPWQAEAALPGALQAPGAVESGGKIYVVGGLESSGVSTKVRIYNPAAKSWSEGPELPDPRHHVAMATVGTDIYAVGGLSDTDYTPIDKVSVLKAGASAWEGVSALVLNRGAAVAAAIDGKIYVAGGVGDNKKQMGDVVMFDPGNGNWTVESALPTPREHVSGFAYGGKLYVVGGRLGSPNAQSADVDIYDPASKSWSAGAPLPTPRGELGCALLGDKAYAIGGEALTGGLDTVEVLDLAAGTWSSAPPLSTPRHGAGVVALSGRVYVIGGASAANIAPLDLVESYAP